jgi:hypothetical protein
MEAVAMAAMMLPAMRGGLKVDATELEDSILANGFGIP